MFKARRTPRKAAGWLGPAAPGAGIRFVGEGPAEGLPRSAEDLLHRNMAFTLIHADAMPIMKMGETKVERMGSGMHRVWVANQHVPGKSEVIDQTDLKRIMIRSGPPGPTTKTIEYLVRGTGDMAVTYSSVKGGTVSTTVRVR